MRVTCENCRTVYESAGHDLCPFCQHANRLPEGAGAREPDSTVAVPAAEEHDPLKTMVFGVGATTAAPHAGGGENVGLALPLGARMELVVVTDAKQTERHAITRTVTIGRGLCDIRVHDPEVSREHCAIELREGVPVLKDLQSANGTLLNGESVLEHVLTDGDEIQVGSTRLRFQLAR